MSLKATAKYRRTMKGLATNLYQKIRERSVRNNWLVSFSLMDFHEWFFSQIRMYILYKDWRESGYSSKLRPSVDRIDSKLPYVFENMQVLTWEENRRKGDWENSLRTTEVVQISTNGQIVAVYPSIKKAVQQTGCNQGLISACCQGRRRHTGGFVWRYGSSLRFPGLVSTYLAMSGLFVEHPDILK